MSRRPIRSTHSSGAWYPGSLWTRPREEEPWAPAQVTMVNSACIIERGVCICCSSTAFPVSLLR